MNIFYRGWTMTGNTSVQIPTPAGKCCNLAVLLQLQLLYSSLNGCHMKMFSEMRPKTNFMWNFTTQQKKSVIWMKLNFSTSCHRLSHAEWVLLQPEARHWTSQWPEVLQRVPIKGLTTPQEVTSSKQDNGLKWIKHVNLTQTITLNSLLN